MLIHDIKKALGEKEMVVYLYAHTLVDIVICIFLFHYYCGNFFFIVTNVIILFLKGPMSAKLSNKDYTAILRIYQNYGNNSRSPA